MTFSEDVPAGQRRVYVMPGLELSRAKTHPALRALQRESCVYSSRRMPIPTKKHGVQCTRSFPESPRNVHASVQPEKRTPREQHGIAYSCRFIAVIYYFLSVTGRNRKKTTQPCTKRTLSILTVFFKHASNHSLCVSCGAQRCESLDGIT